MVFLPQRKISHNKGKLPFLSHIKVELLSLSEIIMGELSLCIQEKLILWVTFIPGLALTEQPRPDYNKLTWDESAIQSKTSTSADDVRNT